MRRAGGCKSGGCRIRIVHPSRVAARLFFAHAEREAATAAAAIALTVRPLLDRARQRRTLRPELIVGALPHRKKPVPAAGRTHPLINEHSTASTRTVPDDPRYPAYGYISQLAR